VKTLGSGIPTSNSGFLLNVDHKKITKVVAHCTFDYNVDGDSLLRISKSANEMAGAAGDILLISHSNHSN
jgi:hypothetical protein